MKTPKIDLIFHYCVVLLLWLASILRLTYKQVNVLIFCILWPILTIILGITALK